MTERARTVFLGSGRFAVESLGRLAEHDAVQLVGVVTAAARPSGRGGRLTATPVDAAAATLRLQPILRPPRLREPRAIDEVLALEPDLAVLADYGQIVPPPLLRLPHGALNVHPSLLPRHRGAAPIPAAILAGDEQTGVTLMQMDEGLDSGPILAREVVPLGGNETAAELEERLALLAAELLERELPAWLRGELEPRAQPSEGATLTRPLRRQDGRLDPQRAAAQLERQVRAYQPWPGSFVDTAHGRLVVWRARPVRGEPGLPPGALVAPGGEPGRLALVTSAGLLEILEAQPAGGRRMHAADLLRGRPLLLGSRVNEPVAG